MQTDITRQASASAYMNSSFRERIYAFVKEPYLAIVDSYGVNTSELLKHIFNARRINRNYYQALFLPSLFFWGFIILVFISEGESLESGGTLIGLIAYMIAYSIVLTRDSKERSFLKKNFYKDTYNPNFEFDKTNSHLINKFQKRLSGNLVVYSGYSPFVGSGIDVGGWSFVVDTDKGKKVMDKRLSPIDFQLSEIYAQVDDEIEGLNIPNLMVKDKVFINGKKIRGNSDLLPNKLGSPTNNVSQEFIEEVMNEDDKEARFYRVIQVTDWGGDLVLTSFLRFQKSYKSLFVENNYFILPPISEEFKAIDSIKETSGFKHLIGWLTGMLFVALGHSFISIFKVLGYISEVFSEITGGQEKAMREIVKTSPDYDYGARTSIREAISQTQYSQHFQKLDKERYIKTIEKRIFNLIGDFLDSKNIDTSEFKERETNILNQGVIVTGGNLSGENIAVGKGSKIDFGKKNK